MKISFTPHGWDDYCSWVGDRKTLTRINRLIADAARDPGVGTGKPERLSGDLAGFCFFFIDKDNSVFYTLHGDDLVIVQARYHY